MDNDGKRTMLAEVSDDMYVCVDPAGVNVPAKANFKNLPAKTNWCFTVETPHNLKFVGTN